MVYQSCQNNLINLKINKIIYYYGINHHYTLISPSHNPIIKN